MADVTVSSSTSYTITVDSDFDAANAVFEIRGDNVPYVLLNVAETGILTVETSQIKSTGVISIDNTSGVGAIIEFQYNTTVVAFITAGGTGVYTGGIRLCEV